MGLLSIQKPYTTWMRQVYSWNSVLLRLLQRRGKESKITDVRTEAVNKCYWGVVVRRDMSSALLLYLLLNRSTICGQGIKELGHVLQLVTMDE